MTPLVETVARAISRKVDSWGDTERVEQQRVSLEWPRYREHAQAAIAAVFDADPRITALQAENEKLREALLAHKEVAKDYADEALRLREALEAALREIDGLEPMWSMSAGDNLERACRIARAALGK